MLRFRRWPFGSNSNSQYQYAMTIMSLLSLSRSLSSSCSSSRNTPTASRGAPPGFSLPYQHYQQRPQQSWLLAPQQSQLRFQSSSSSSSSKSSSSSSSSSSPPQWIADLRDTAKQSESHISYDIRIYNELAWRKMRFSFDNAAWDPHKMSAMLRRRLCLGADDGLSSSSSSSSRSTSSTPPSSSSSSATTSSPNSTTTGDYTLIGEAFPFPDREDSPVVNEPHCPCRLLWDHNSPTEKIMLQLSDHTPPLLWITVKPTIEALRRVFAEFLDADAQHMKKYLPYYESVQQSLENQHRNDTHDNRNNNNSNNNNDEKKGESFADGTLSPLRMRDRFRDDMRRRDPGTIENDWDREVSLYLGPIDHFSLAEDDMMKRNPFVFGWPLLLGEGNHHLDGTPLRVAAFRTIHSKSLILFQSRLDLQLDHRLAQLAPGDEPDVSQHEVPLFVTINYASNARMCGGAALVARYNRVMSTSFPPDTPIDVLAAFCHVTTQKSSGDLYQEVLFLDAAAKKSGPGEHVERVVRLSDDMLSANRLVGQLAYTIVCLALVGGEAGTTTGSPSSSSSSSSSSNTNDSHHNSSNNNNLDVIRDVLAPYSAHQAAIVRIACVKGAEVMGEVELVEQLIAAEQQRLELTERALAEDVAKAEDKSSNSSSSSKSDSDSSSVGDATGRRILAMMERCRLRPASEAGTAAASGAGGVQQQ